MKAILKAFRNFFLIFVVFVIIAIILSKSENARNFVTPGVQSMDPQMIDPGVGQPKKAE